MRIGTTKRVVSWTALLFSLALPLRAVETTISVATPEGEALGSATIQLFDAEGAVVAEEKADDDGMIVLDLPEGRYTAKTIDGAHAIELRAGERVSLVLPLLYGILDNAAALTDYFRNFQGSPADYRDAWALVDPEIASQVEQSLQSGTDALSEGDADSARPADRIGAAESGPEQAAGRASSDGAAPGSELAGILTDVEALTRYFRDFQGCGSSALWAWNQLDPAIAAQVKAALGAARAGAPAPDAQATDLQSALDDPDAMTEYFRNFQGCGTERLEVWRRMDDDVARQVSERLRMPPERPAEGGVQAGSELAGILTNVKALTEYFQHFQGCGTSALWAWDQLDPAIASQVQAALETGGHGAPASATRESDLEARLDDPDAMTEYFRDYQGCGTQRLFVFKMMSSAVANVVLENLQFEKVGTLDEQDLQEVSVDSSQSGPGEDDEIGIGFPSGRIPDLEYALWPVEREDGEDDDSWTDPRDGEETALDSGVDITTGDPTSMNLPGSEGASDSAVQKMMVEISMDGQGMTIAPGKSASVRIPRPLTLAAVASRRSIWPPRSLAVGSFGFSTASRLVQPTVVQVATRRQGRSAPAAGPSSGTRLQILFTNIGNSTGEAFTARIFNPGSTPLNIQPGALVVEALKDKAGQKVQKELARLVGPHMPELPSLSLDAYCLEFLKLPPAAGTIFRIAQSEIQRRFKDSRSILRASRELYSAGKLHPDVAPEVYFHSIRQWALWTDQEGFDSTSFADAFIRHTRKNVEAAGGSWSKQYETVLRSAVGGRWNDIRAILRAAGRP